jgi:hypothetical protein|tara:strand:+ start:499 stop:807 length:309 start_codon:yes stop_codon:yes gene_type:complete
MKYKVQQIPDNGSRYMPGKLEKLEKIQLLMVSWLNGKITNVNWMSGEDEKTKDEWERTMNYVLKCEDRPLTAKDIKKLNFLYKFYKHETMNMSIDYLNNMKA